MLLARNVQLVSLKLIDLLLDIACELEVERLFVKNRQLKLAKSTQVDSYYS